MSRKGVVVFLAICLVCYILARVINPPSVAKETKSAPLASAAIVDQPLPPEKLSQFQGMSVYTPPPPPKELWINPQDGPPPRKDKNEKYIM